MYLADCDIDEIRCVWFLDHQQQSGMVMTINIRKYRVDTVRDVHNWARQASHSQKLSDSQVNTLKRLVGELPPSDKDVEFAKGVSVAVRKDGKVAVRRYDPQISNAVLQRIYDIGGGKFPEATTSRTP